jgi:hypothetical protein
MGAAILKYVPLLLASSNKSKMVVFITRVCLWKCQEICPPPVRSLHIFFLFRDVHEVAPLNLTKSGISSVLNDTNSQNTHLSNGFSDRNYAIDLATIKVTDSFLDSKFVCAERGVVC